MLDKTVRRKTFMVAIGALGVLVVLAVSILYFWTNRSDTLMTAPEIEKSTSSDTSAYKNSTTSTQISDMQQKTLTVEATTVTRADAGSSTRKKQTTTASSVMDESTSAVETTGSPKNVKKNELIVIGDSLIGRDSTPSRLVDKLAANGWQQISIDAKGGRRNHLGSASNIDFVSILKEVENSSYDVFSSGASPPRVHQNMLKKLYENDQSTLSKISDDTLDESFRQADVVVVSLGTNDQTDAVTMEAGIRLTVASIKKINPDITIYWVRMCAQGHVKSKGNVFNPIAEKLSQELGFTLIDWASQCKASYQHDGVHYNEQGIEAFTDVLVAGIQ